MKTNIKVLISGGGTGGHIFPAVAIAQQIKAEFPHAEFLFVGANGKMEMEKIPQLGYPIKGLNIAGFDRGNLLSNIGLPLKLFKSLQEARKIVREFQPDLAIGTGGFASGPALYAAAKRGVPTFIQEQNAHAGVTNKVLGKKAKRIFTAYPNVAGFDENKTRFFGNPIRQNILTGLKDSAEAKREMGLSPEKVTILSVGGSLGSRTLNEGWKKHLDELLALDYQLIWQTGKQGYSDILNGTEKAQNKNVQVHEFIKNMELAYSAADVIVSRAGAIAISELAVVKKPVLLVPFPFAAENHQTLNAKRLVDRGAALMVKDSEMDEKFWSSLTEITSSEVKRKEMSEQITFFAKEHAAQDIVREIIEVLKLKD